MEGLGAAANVIAVVELTANVAKLCFQYSTAVAGAREDIVRLQRHVEQLGSLLKKAQDLDKSPSGPTLASMNDLTGIVLECKEELEKLRDKLDPGNTDKAMSRFGLRALKWPFDSKEIDHIMANIDRYQKAISLAFQIEDRELLLSINDKMGHLSLSATQDSSIARKPHFIVPFPRDPDFVPRASIWEHITEKYSSAVSRMALVGMGGFGKTQMAIQFAYHIHDTQPDTSIFWVHGSTRARFEESYRSIADVLALPRRHDHGTNILPLLRDWLQREDVSPWLMILDNADDVEVFFPPSNDGSPSKTSIASYLPKTDRGKILVTSRSLTAAEKLAGGLKEILKVSTMEGPEAVQLIRNKLVGTVNEDDTKALAGALGFIPLALNQAAAYVNRRAPLVTVRSYLDDFQKSPEQKESLLNRDAGDLRRYEGVSNSVVATWQVTFEQIKRERPTAAHLLSFMSYFHPHSIPDYMLSCYNDSPPESKDVSTWQVILERIRRKRPTAGHSLSIMSRLHPRSISKLSRYNNNNNKNHSSESDDVDGGGYEPDSRREYSADYLDKDLQDDLDVLRGYDLINLTSTPRFYEMHSLVQFCTQVWLSRFGDPDRWKSQFLRHAANHFPSGDFETWGQCQILLPHVYPILYQEPTTRNDRLEWCDLLGKVAYYMCQMGKYSVAEELANHTSRTRTGILGEEHFTTMWDLSTLAWVFRVQGRLGEAEQLLVKLMRTSREVMGEDSLITVSVTSELAAVHTNQGRWEEAESLEAWVLEARKRILGEEHPRTLESMETMWGILDNRGRFEEANLLSKQVLEARKRLLGEEHPHTLESMGNISVALNHQGRFEEAGLLCKQVFEARKRLLGEEHPLTIRSMGNLTWNLTAQGRLEEAELLGVQVMEATKRILGDEHPDTLVGIGTLSRILASQGRLEEAEVLGVQGVEANKKLFGERHPQSMRSVALLSVVLSLQGRFEEAESLRMQAIEMSAGLLGEEHPETLGGMHNLGLLWNEMGRRDEARTMMQDCLRLRQKVLGPEHPYTQDSDQLVKRWQEEAERASEGCPQAERRGLDQARK